MPKGASTYPPTPLTGGSVPVLPVRNTVLFPNTAVPLVVGRPKSIQAIHDAQARQGHVLVLAQKDGTTDDPVAGDLYRVGVVCSILKLTKLEKEGYQLVLSGMYRFQANTLEDTGDFLTATGERLPEAEIEDFDRVQALTQEIRGLGKSILSMASISGAETLAKLFDQLQDGGHIADLCCTFLVLPIAVKQQLLEHPVLDRKLERLFELMVREKGRISLQDEIRNKMMERLSKEQRDHLLREQLRTIHEELGEESSFFESAQKKLDSGEMSEEAAKAAKEELARLQTIPRTSPEHHVIRGYLDWLFQLPWKKTSPGRMSAAGIDLAAARAILDEDHFGIENAKKRILQFLAVSKLRKSPSSQVLCFLGPPGVGKTSLVKSIARALNRPFVRISLGGVRDEAEIRGHRRTYIGAMPGRLLQSLRRVGVKDPVLLLDELDKVNSDYRGDPASALLEVLDPEQNKTFTDHYLDLPFDLSEAFFVTTANAMETLPPALRDRLEVIEMTSYSRAEKKEIANRHLIPKLLHDHGMEMGQVILTPDVVEQVLDGYTREAGVRQLSRELAHLFRHAAEALVSDVDRKPVIIDTPRVVSILGPRKFWMEDVSEEYRPGVVTGLAWTPVGGTILRIEVARLEGKGNLLLTGQLGDVMKESVQIALTLARLRYSRSLSHRFDKVDFHVHVPAGAISKDGPSAGLGVFLAFVSLLEAKPVPSSLAITGEITLRGSVLPVGGIKEKIIAAHRAGAKTVLIPKQNAKDVEEVPRDVRDQLDLHFAQDVSEALAVAGFISMGLPTSPSAIDHYQPELSFLASP